MLNEPETIAVNGKKMSLDGLGVDFLPNMVILLSPWDQSKYGSTM